jgi:hypothetical protein
MNRLVSVQHTDGLSISLNFRVSFPKSPPTVGEYYTGQVDRFFLSRRPEGDLVQRGLSRIDYHVETLEAARHHCECAKLPVGVLLQSTVGTS